jgi:hypothetical protein
MTAQKNGTPASLPEFVPVVIVGARPHRYHRRHAAGAVRR